MTAFDPKRAPAALRHPEVVNAIASLLQRCRCTDIEPSPTNPLACRFAACPVHDVMGALRGAA